MSRSVYYLLMGISVLLILGMLYSFVTVLTEGHGVTALGNWGTEGKVPWGLDIGAFSWWASMGVGALALLSVIRVFDLEKYEPIARIGVFVAPLAFLASFLHILFDLGQPFRVLNTIIYLPLESPIAWDVILLSGVGILSFLLLIVSLRKYLYETYKAGLLPSTFSPVYEVLLTGYTPREDSDKRGAFWWLAAAVLVFIPVVGGGVVPFVWGPLGVDINWFGAIQGPTFLLGSMAVGAAALLLLACLVRYFFDADELYTDGVLRTFGVFTGAFAFTYLLGVIWEIQTGTFAADLADPNITLLIFGGDLAWLLWLAVAAIVIPTIYLLSQLAVDRFSLLGTTVVTAVLLVGVLHQETWLTVGGLSYPEMMYPEGEYTPSMYEWLNLMGTTGLVAFGLLVFVRVFPVIPASEKELRRPA
ncbi:NrfD/PsrC family molybdoenzyme membrane anchor subunit [Salinibacter altiplanensis]|uniref:NrfD/PsrC family molybdoenzyme membrane anchor subunit n=1 Tax=Salinibacter altiplanensis TaxID=1803181 RepID=UPI0018F89EA8|nr:NrfD/PsrC family molybdoenzyme membrane anchor subunit [Salinibacter altiplanensis]